MPEHTMFAVNVLSEEQQSLAVRFARATDDERFNEVQWRQGPEGVPLISGAVAAFVCRLEQDVRSGDHRILIGTVKEIHRAEGYPLVWCASSYHCLPKPSGVTD